MHANCLLDLSRFPSRWSILAINWFEIWPTYCDSLWFVLFN